MIPLSRQLACAQRTVERERKRMAKLELSHTQFNRHAWLAEIANMEAIVETLERLTWFEEVSEEIKREMEAKATQTQAAQPAAPAE